MRRALWVFLALTSAAYGGPILTRPDLMAALGGSGTLEDFEAFPVSPGISVGLDCSTLNSSSSCNGHSGLVVPGVDFTFGSGGGQWDGVGYLGAPSEEILSGSPGGQPLVITFTNPVNAFGLDLRAFTEFPASATLTIYGLDNTTIIGTISNVNLSSDGSPVFEGWQDFAGIGQVSLTQTGQYWSPIIDNVEFGLAQTPEPSSAALLGLGLGVFTLGRHLLRRRS